MVKIINVSEVTSASLYRVTSTKVGRSCYANISS